MCETCTHTYTQTNFTAPLTTPERPRSQGLWLEVKKGGERNGRAEEQRKKVKGGKTGN